MSNALSLLPDLRRPTLTSAFIASDDEFILKSRSISPDPWRLCTVTRVEEVKCMLRLIPIWLTTILYFVIFTQMASLFVEQGAAMNTQVAGFPVPPSSMSAFDILRVAAFILLYRRLLNPLVVRLRGNPRGMTELQWMGVGLVLAVAAMVTAGTVETR